MGNWLGAKHWIGFAPQTTPGTANATTTDFLATSKIKVAANPKLVDRKAWIATGLNLPGKPGWIMPTFTADCEVHASQPHPWYWALGNVSSSLVTSGVYLHTMTDAGAPVRLTVEANDVYQSAKQGDGYVNKLTFGFKVLEIATLTLEGMALSHTEPATLTSTPSFTTDPVVCNTASIKIAGSTDLTVTDGTIDWDGQLVQLPTLQNVNVGQPQVIRRDKPPVITGTLNFLDFPTAQLAAMIAGTTFALVVELDGANISGAYNKFIRVTLPCCQYTGGLDTEITDAVVTGSANFTAAYDTVTAKQILVEAQNTIALINA